MAKRKTIGRSPFDSVIPPRQESLAVSEVPKSDPPKNEPKAKPSKKRRFTVHLPPELIERVRDAVWWTPGITLASLAEEALLDAIHQLEKKRGEPFPPREADLKGGRPLKS